MDEATLAKFVWDLQNSADANPALGIRISFETIQDELNEFSPRSYARERLSMWPSPTEAGYWRSRSRSGPTRRLTIRIRIGRSPLKAST
jgi:hypothetical protein